jgi:hypothetical protein
MKWQKRIVFFMQNKNIYVRDELKGNPPGVDKMTRRMFGLN